MKKKGMKKEVKGAPTVIRIKKAGWIYIALCIFMGVGAVNTANNLVYIIVALMLAFMAVSGIFGAADIKHMEVSFGFPDEIFAGRDIPVSVTLENRRRLLPAFLIRVHFNDRSVLFPYMEPNTRFTKFTAMLFEKRGEFRVEHVYVSTVFPFNFFIRYKDVEAASDVIVFPSPVASDDVYGISKGNEKHGETDTNRKGFDPELLSIRDYKPGDPLKYIHWKATARTGVVKVKEMSAQAAKPVFIEFDKMEGETERKLSAAAWLICELSGAGRPVGLRIGETVYEPDASKQHRYAMLKELALYG